MADSTINLYETLTFVDQEDTDLKLWLKFNETSGTIAFDSSQYGNDGIIQGPNFFMNHRGERVFAFVPSDRVEIPSILTPRTLTFECWFKKEGDGDGPVPRLFTSDNLANFTAEIGVGKSVIPNSLGFDLFFTDESYTSWVPVYPVSPNEWYHMVLTWDGTSVKMFVNGNEEYSSTLWSGKTINQDSLFIGGGTIADDFAGQIDEVRVYDRALTDIEIFARYDTTKENYLPLEALFNLGQEKIFNKMQKSLQDVIRINPVPKGLVAYWTLDEETGNLALDHSGNELHGTLVPSTNPPTHVSGRQLNALEFDGIDNIVDFGNPSELQITPKQSVSFWMYANSSEDMIPIMKKYNDNLDSWGWAIFLLFGGRIYIRGNTNAQFYAIQTYANQWLHVVGIWDGTQGTLYINGEPTTGTLNEIDLTYMGNLKIGKGWSAYEYFNGIIDEVRIYNRILSEEEVKVLFNLGQERLYKQILPATKEEKLTFLTSVTASLSWVQQVVRAVINIGPVRVITKLKEKIENL